jgi:hypothetical protein
MQDGKCTSISIKRTLGIIFKEKSFNGDASEFDLIGMHKKYMKEND